MTPHASKEGKLDRFAAIFLFIFLPCMWVLGFQNDSPISPAIQRRRNDTIHKMCVLAGVGEGKFEGKVSKTTNFPGTLHDE